MIQIFDTHAHYDDEQFDEDRDELLKSMPDLGVGTIVDVSATYESCEKVLTLAESIHMFMLQSVCIRMRLENLTKIRSST